MLCQLRKPVSLLIVSVLALSLLAGCGGAPAATATPLPAPTDTPAVAEAPTDTPVPEATPTEPPAETPTAEPTPEPVTEISGTIRVGSWESGEALDPWNRAIAGFQAMYPDVTVQLEAVPQGYGDKLLTQFAAGTAPDVFMVGDGDVARFVQRGAVELLDPYINGNNPLDLSLFLPGLLEIGQIDGQTYLLTKDYSPLVVYYNKDLFDEAGLDYPQAGWTWDDFLATAQALTVDEDGDGQIDQWGIQLPNHWGDVTWWRGISPFVFQAGGDILSSDGTTTTGYMNSPETVEAIQFYVDLYREHQVAPGPEDLGALAGVDLFQTGMVGMLWTGRWPLADFKANPNLNFGTVGLPMGKQHANSICWAGFALYSESPNKDTAWAFLKYIAAEEGAEAFADYALTAVAPIAEAQGLTEDPYDGPIIEDLQYLHPLPEFRTMYFSECVEQNFKAAVERLLLQGGDVQAAMDEAAAAADACLARQQ